MPLDPADAAAIRTLATDLEDIRQRLDTLAQGAAAVADATDPADTIAICRATYGEISNYDRHYSTVRSALTTLVVGAGLVAAAEPFKNLSNVVPTACGGCKNLQCVLLPVISALPAFAVTWLLFVLAVLVSLYFQRFTFVCRRLEEEIEQRIASIAGLRPYAPQQVLGADVSAILFRTDFQAAYKKARFWYFDPMSTLLLSGIVTFIFIVVVYCVHQCAGLPRIPHLFHAELFFYAVTLGILFLVLWLINKYRATIYVVFTLLGVAYFLTWM